MDRLRVVRQQDDDDATASAILRAALDAIVVIDHESRILEFNPAAETLFGRSRADVIGLDVADLLIPEALRAAHREGMRRYLAGAPSTLIDRRLELEAQRSDGTLVPIELCVTQLKRLGQPVFAAFMRDISLRKRLQSAQARSEARLTAVVRAQQELAANLGTVEDVMDSLARLAQDALSGDGAVFELLEGDELVYRATSGTARGHEGRRLGLTTSLSGHVLVRGEALRCDDCSTDPRIDALAARAVGAGSMALAPIRAGGKAIGVVKVLARDPQAFDDADIRALELLASSVGAVVDRKNEEAAREHALKNRAAVIEVQRELATAPLDLASLMDRVAAEAQALTGGAGATVELAEGDEMIYVATSGRGSPQRGVRQPRHGTLSEACMRAGHVLVCEDTELDPRVDREACRRLGARSLLVAPLRAHGDAFGVLKVGSREPHAFSAEAISNLQILSETLGLLIQRARALEALTRSATHDSVTRLPRFAAVEPAWTARLQETPQAAALLVNLDRFHAINESLGHRRADEVLAALAARLGTLAAQQEVELAHFAADEYVLFGGGFDQAAALALADRVRASVGVPLEADGYRVQLSATVGIALAPEHGSSAIDLVRRAQFAMEHGKKLGRDRVSVFLTGRMQEIEDRVLLGDRLRQAALRGELELHYQPRVRAGDYALAGFEALLRWNHPELGQVSPARFIPIGEALGLMPDIGSWVIREAARQARAWLDAGHGGFSIAVNVSAQQLQRDGLVECVADALAAAGLPPSVLEIEFTESSLMENVARVRDELARLKALGVVLALDDFGTGYSSLAYLRQFSLDRLKIDRSFVRGLPENADDAAIAGMIVSIGHQLRLHVVAEGVETPEQAAFLSELGCDGLQGYHFARPMPAAQAEAFLGGKR